MTKTGDVCDKCFMVNCGGDCGSIPCPLCRSPNCNGLLCPASNRSAPNDVQVGGDHYKKLAIQPIDFIAKNNLPWHEGNIVKYVVRWRFKNGVEDLLKARDYLDKLIASTEGK